MKYIIGIICIILFIYEIYNVNQHPDLYMGLGKTNWLAAAAMADIGFGCTLYMFLKTIAAKRIITAHERYKKYTKMSKDNR